MDLIAKNVNKAYGYSSMLIHMCIIIGFYLFKKINMTSINLEASVAGTAVLGARTGGGLDPKVEEYINHTMKVYRDEVELYTSRDRSDSMRTRTSSETSQQMHTALDNARQRVLAMASSDNGNSTASYATSSVFADSEPVGGMLDINEILVSLHSVILLVLSGRPYWPK